MLALNLQTDPPCHGRAAVLDQLTRNILGQKRSTVLLYGDSGIGKTTVLEALRDRIRTNRIPDAFCGFYECEIGKDADPAIPCFRDLLDHHLSGVEGWEGQLHIAISKAVKSGKDLANIQRFFLNLTAAAGELPVIGGAFKFASKAVEAIREFTNVRTDFPAVLNIHLPRETFRDLVHIVLEAFPSKKLVFIVDNVSADTESLATAGSARTTDTIQAILQKDFRGFRGVHFVLSYKEHAPTRTSFKRLLRSVEESGGTGILLDRLSDDEVRQWLNERSDWVPYRFVGGGQSGS